jgi:hypothetical protein
MTIVKVPSIRHEHIPSIHIQPPTVETPSRDEKLSPNHYKVDRPEKQHHSSTTRNRCKVVSKWLIYALVVLFLCLNAFALMNRVNTDTIYFLRIYQLVGALAAEFNFNKRKKGVCFGNYGVVNEKLE